MIERFDHRPMLTALLALSTTVLVVVVVTLLIMFPPAASPQSHSGGGGNPAGAAAPANMDAGGENYGWDIQPEPAQTGDSVERHAKPVNDYPDGPYPIGR
jgi:hypothetical protein